MPVLRRQFFLCSSSSLVLLVNLRTKGVASLLGLVKGSLSNLSIIIFRQPPVFTCNFIIYITCMCYIFGPIYLYRANIGFLMCTYFKVNLMKSVNFFLSTFLIKAFKNSNLSFLSFVPITFFSKYEY